MARPRSTDLTITECPGRARPWRVRWRETTQNGGRRRAAKFFATQADAQAFVVSVHNRRAATPTDHDSLPSARPPRYDDLPDLCTPDDARAFLQVGRNTMYGLLKSGAIESITFGRLIRIPKNALLRREV
jgi:excisionase family DNA binding protein